MTLYPHQQRALDFIGRSPHKLLILAMQMGTGKTAVALKAVRTPALVVAPAFLIHNWRNEAALWRPDLRVNVLGPRTPFAPDALNITSYGKMGKHVLPTRLRTLVFDESHALKSPEAARTQIAARIVAAAKRVLLLSGTPVITATPSDLHPMLFAAGYTPMGYTAWIKRYASAFRNQWGKWQMGRAAHVEEVEALIRPYIFRITREECLSLPPKVRRLILIGGTEPEVCASFDPEEVARNPNRIGMEGLSEAMRIAGEWRAPAVAEYVADAFADSGSPIVVFCHHRSVAAILREALEKTHRVAVITGETSMDERARIVDAFQAGRYDILIGSIGAMGVGITLTRSRHCVFAETNWDYAAFDQAESRLYRIGQELPVVSDALCVSKSLDHAILARMLAKRSLSEELLDRRRLELEALAAELI
jgi:SWI/SNF-related matrix-associated actin-dependent regulator 1 of chromatin subfamily A